MTAQYGPHRWSAGYHDDGTNDALRGATFEVKDLRETRFVDCDLTGARIVDGCLVDVDVSGYVAGLVVNGVDVTEYVETQLDLRHPERVQLRGVRDADGFRAMWDTVERLWADTLARAERLPEEARHERVQGEWSLVETLRHLVFITDSWASRTILDQERPFHPLALPQTAYAPADAVALGMDLGARPTYDEVVAARADRLAVVRGILDGLGDEDLGRPCTRSPAPGYPEEERAVYECLAVVMEEECEHHRFATRDLAVLEDR
ncbi:DinB family protein [Nocardioides sp. 503]|uniref:DinB family protein n=1 Tax=Nocardioides sp. 503 TaxID=2508326 RepID=UPI00107067EA|nr:DinB family protein [Nocardioides sp. 503]